MIVAYSDALNRLFSLPSEKNATEADQQPEVRS